MFITDAIKAIVDNIKQTTLVKHPSGSFYSPLQTDVSPITVELTVVLAVLLAALASVSMLIIITSFFSWEISSERSRRVIVDTICYGGCGCSMDFSVVIDAAEL